MAQSIGRVVLAGRELSRLAGWVLLVGYYSGLGLVLVLYCGFVLVLSVVRVGCGIIEWGCFHAIILF